MFITFSTVSYSQNKKCEISDVQIETYKYTTQNLQKIAKQFSDKNSLIEVSIEIKNKKLEKIEYNLILPENNYSGENKAEIKIWKGLNQFIFETVNRKIKNCLNFNYEKIIFRVPISIENINKAIEEVNETIIGRKNTETEIKN